MKQHTLEFALDADKKDELAYLRNEFIFPKGDGDEPWLYFTGNSLGLQPKSASKAVQGIMDDWANLAVEGHFLGDNPWTKYNEQLTDKMAKVVGAKPIEVVISNTLTTNLHLLMVSFYQPTKKRFKIVIESDAFPSDRYAVESQLKFHGFDPKEGLVEWSPKPGNDLLDYEDLQEILDEQGDEIALLLIGGVNYYTGQFFDFKRLAQMGHQAGAIVGIDLAHGAGNIQPKLHESGVDFASWCTYKYMNSGPGSLSGIFVHEKHAHNSELPRFAGWWNHNASTRFNMRLDFDVIPGAEGWQLSNHPILSMAPIKASLELFEKVGMDKLRSKSLKLTAYLESLILNLDSNRIKIITPKNPEERGCQLSLQVQDANRSLHDALIARGVITDWREPDVIRVAPTPMYNSYEDVYRFVEILKELM
ncbi:kynureninase [Flavobacteriaceae bacterium]|nr:kynureninase [Flavobacteriaceae bacterium]